VATNSPKDWFKAVGPKAAHDSLQDATNAGYFQLMADMMDQFAEAPEDILLVSTEAKKIKRARLAAEGHAEGSHFKSFGTAKQLDEEIVIQWLVQNSDMEEDDILKARQFDSDAPAHLYCHALALGMSYKHHDNVRVVDAWSSWACERHAAHQKPLEHFKASGGLLPNGQLNWKDRTFKMEFNCGGNLKGITHVGTGAKAKIDAKCQVTRDYDFKHFWSDVDAFTRMEPFPGVKIASFFNKGKSPFGANIAFGVNRKDLQEAFELETQKHLQAYRAKLEAVKGTSSEAMQRLQIQGNLKKQTSDARKVQMDATRAKALETVKKKGDKRKTDA